VVDSGGVLGLPEAREQVDVVRTFTETSSAWSESSSASSSTEERRTEWPQATVIFGSGRRRCLLWKSDQPRASDGSQGRGERTRSGERGAGYLDSSESSVFRGSHCRLRRGIPL
jgi:hypothetical protein